MALLNILPVLNAQITMVDVVYMKNRSYLRGEIIQTVPEKHVKLIVASKDTLVIPITDIDSIRKENVVIPVKPGKLVKYFFLTEIHTGAGAIDGEDKSDPKTGMGMFGFGVVNGIAITSRINLGVFTGIDFWRNRGFIPVCFDYRYNFLSTYATPYFSFRGGYSFGWSGDGRYNKGGAVLGLALGGKFKVFRANEMYLSAGYHLQEFRWYNNVSGLGHFATLNVGFIF